MSGLSHQVGRPFAPRATPPALSANPSFTSEYWEKVPREKAKLKLVRITDKVDADEHYTEFVFDDDSAFMRKTSDLVADIKLHVNQTVYVETIRGELVTGLWVPDQGWAFRMSAQDLAEYAQRLASLMHQKQQEARGQLREFVARALRDGLGKQVDLIGWDEGVVELGEGGPTINLNDLADGVVDALSQARGPQK